VAPGNLIIIISAHFKGHHHSSHHPNAHMIQIRRILGMKTSRTPRKKIYYYYIKAFTGAGI
jgi:hypothetical protein